MTKMPTPDSLVFVCTACTNWQIDVTRRVVQDEGAQAAVLLVAQTAAEHTEGDCPGGTTGRVKVRGQWVERIAMPTGETATGMLEAHPLPRWWVTR